MTLEDNKQRRDILDKKLNEAGKYLEPTLGRFVNEAMEEYATWKSEDGMRKLGTWKGLSVYLNRYGKDVEYVTGPLDTKWYFVNVEDLDVVVKRLKALK